MLLCTVYSFCLAGKARSLFYAKLSKVVIFAVYCDYEAALTGWGMKKFGCGLLSAFSFCYCAVFSPFPVCFLLVYFVPWDYRRVPGPITPLTPLFVNGGMTRLLY